MSRRILIVGGVAAGASAATRARRLDEHAEIVVFEKSGYVSFANCGLPYYVGNVIRSRSALLLMTPERLAQQFRIDARVRQEVVEIDRAAKRVLVCGLDGGGEYWEEYDRLILTPGARVHLRPATSAVGCRGSDAGETTTVPRKAIQPANLGLPFPPPPVEPR